MQVRSYWFLPLNYMPLHMAQTATTIAPSRKCREIPLVWHVCSKERSISFSKSNGLARTKGSVLSIDRIKPRYRRKPLFSQLRGFLVQVSRFRAYNRDKKLCKYVYNISV